MALSFGVLLREHRRNAGLTQEQLAARAAVSIQAVGALERGARRFPYQYTIDRLADALGLDGEQRTAFATAAGRQPPPPVQLANLTLPRQLPAPALLTGRDTIASEITARTRETGAALLVGPGGIGKTALALAVGDRLAAEFPGGQLFADLHGAHEQPADPHLVLGRFLRALGTPASAVPSDRDERLAAYRSLLGGRRVLLVLDDAASEEQIRPLLPPAGNCATIVTSRRHLGALLNVARWTVPALIRQDALRLLAHIAGADRIASEPDAAAQVAHACGYSPLALCVAAARLAVRPDWTVADLGRRLTAEHGRLDALAVGDLDVRASIGLSYQALGDEHRQLLRRLALLWMPDWPAWVADELCTQAEPLLDELVNIHLVEPVGSDSIGQQRFRLHDLIAEFARERALAEENTDDLALLVGNLLRAWLALATAADDAAGNGYDYGLDLSHTAAPQRPLTTVHEAPSAWFEVERVALVTAVSRARDLGQAEIAGALALRLAGFLRVRGYRDDHLSMVREALKATHCPRLRLRLTQTLFSAYVDQDLDAEMPDLVTEMLTLAESLGEPDLRIRALMQAGLYAKRRGRLAEAASFYEQSLAACDDAPAVLLSTALSCVAVSHFEAGRPHEALSFAERAVAVQRTAGATVMTALRLLTYAEALTDLGRLSDAETALAESMALCRAAQHEAACAYGQLRLGVVAVRRGQWEAASRLLHEALDTFERLADAGSTAYTLRSLGDLALAQDRPREALEPLHRALNIWQRVRLPLEAARVHARLHRALATLGDACAAEHEAACQRILDELGLELAALRLTGV